MTKHGHHNHYQLYTVRAGKTGPGSAGVWLRLHRASVSSSAPAASRTAEFNLQLSEHSGLSFGSVEIKFDVVDAPAKLSAVAAPPTPCDDGAKLVCLCPQVEAS